MPIATEQDRQEFNELMQDDAKARAFWWAQLAKVLELNKILHEFVSEIDKVANNQKPIDPIEVKLMVKDMRKRVNALAMTVRFGKAAIEQSAISLDT